MDTRLRVHYTGRSQCGEMERGVHLTVGVPGGEWDLRGKCVTGSRARAKESRLTANSGACLHTAYYHRREPSPPCRPPTRRPDISSPSPPDPPRSRRTTLSLGLVTSRSASTSLLTIHDGVTSKFPILVRCSLGVLY